MAQKEIRTDLFTQSEYAKLAGLTRQRISQMIREGKLNTVEIKGATLVKINKNGSR